MRWVISALAPANWMAKRRIAEGAANLPRASTIRVGRAHRRPGSGLPALVVLVALAALSACATGGGSSAGRSTSTPAPTHITSCPAAASSAPGDRLSRAACLAVLNLAGRVQTTYDPRSQTVQVLVSFVGTRVPRTVQQIGAAQEAVKNACFRAQRALWTYGLPLTQVTVTVQGPILDDFFNLITDWYGGSRLTSKVAAALDWQSAGADGAWARYDQVWLRTAYVPNQYYSASPAATP